MKVHQKNELTSDTGSGKNVKFPITLPNLKEPRQPQKANGKAMETEERRARQHGPMVTDVTEDLEDP